VRTDPCSYLDAPANCPEIEGLGAHAFQTGRRQERRGVRQIQHPQPLYTKISLEEPARALLIGKGSDRVRAVGGAHFE